MFEINALRHPRGIWPSLTVESFESTKNSLESLLVTSGKHFERLFIRRSFYSGEFRRKNAVKSLEIESLIETKLVNKTNLL